MDRKNKAASALMAVFPTAAAFSAFAEDRDNERILASLLHYAACTDLIRLPDRQALSMFIHSHASRKADCIPPDGFDFDRLLEHREEQLNVKLSVRGLTERINGLLDECGIDLPRVSNSMLSRLRKESADTPYKLNVLRSIAFWIGHERPEQSALWNFETLFGLCINSKIQDKNFHEGVRVGFAFYSRGDVIDHEVVEWLRKTLKQYADKSMGYFLSGRWGRVRSHDITTLFIDFPKDDKEGDLTAYRSCLRGAVSLAHQVSIRWALSPYCTKNRFLSIGIAAGDYALADNYLLPILNARLPGDPVIRVTDYVRQCLLINDIRAFLCRKPHETTLYNGETLTIWWVVAFWSMLYFDFIPELIDDFVLKNQPESKKILTRLLFYPGAAEETGSNAVTIYFRRPHNTLLGLEIAKTLYYRGLFREALEILRIVLSTDPTNLTARTLRLVIFRNLALDAPSRDAFEGMLRQAEEEALYVEANVFWQSEDFYCEYAVLHQVRALHTLRRLRNKRPKAMNDAEDKRSKQIVLDGLEMAESLLRRGIAVSPSAIRSSYLLTGVKVLRALLQSNEALFINPDIPLNGNPSILAQQLAELGWEQGISRRSLPPEQRYDFLVHRMTSKGAIHDDSISLDAYRPTTLFVHAVALWDFIPVHTVFLAKRVLALLRSARDTAFRAAENELCIYSFTRMYGEIMPVNTFLEHLDKAIVLVSEQAGPGLHERPEDEIVPQPGERSSLLLTLNW